MNFNLYYAQNIFLIKTMIILVKYSSIQMFLSPTPIQLDSRKIKISTHAYYEYVSFLFTSVTSHTRKIFSKWCNKPNI